MLGRPEVVSRYHGHGRPRRDLLRNWLLRGIYRVAGGWRLGCRRG